MTEDEVNNIGTSTFQDLWCKLWKKTSCSKYYEKEFNLLRRNLIN